MPFSIITSAILLITVKGKSYSGRDLGDWRLNLIREKTLLEPNKPGLKRTSDTQDSDSI